MTQYVIERRKLSDQVAAQLEAKIMGGAYVPGDRLPAERVLMDQFGVGRPAVREALFSLQKKGLIEVVSGMPPRVVEPKPEILLDGLSSSVRFLLNRREPRRHFHELRSFFESGLVRYAARHATESDIARLEKALAANEATLDDMAAFQRTDQAFHFVLAEIPSNPLFIAIHTAISDWLSEQRRTTLLLPGEAKKACEGHAAIYRAVAARDPVLAEQAMTSHLDQLYAAYWEAKDRDGAGAPRPSGRPAAEGE